MVTRVGTTTGTVVRLSEMLRTSCELIRVFNTLWQGAGCGRYRQSWLTTCMAEWRVIDLGIGRTGFREGDVTARAGVVPTRVIGELLGRESRARALRHVADARTDLLISTARARS